MQRNNLDFCKEILLPVFLGIWGPHFPLDLEMLTLRLIYHLLVNFILRTRSATVKRRIGSLNSASWKQQQVVVVVVQSLSRVWLFATSWTAACQTSLSFTISWSSLKFMSTELMMASNHLIFLPSSPPALNLSQHQSLFQWVGSLHQVA